MTFTAPSFIARVLLASMLTALPARAVLFYDTSDTTHNTTAPTGTFADSGWQFEGRYGTFLGTMIGSQYFITAQHIGLQGSTFIQEAVFNGTGDITYNIDSSANSGLGYWDIAGTDFRVLKIVETFSNYATLYQGTAEVTSTAVIMGNGGPRGSDVIVDSGLGPELKGWQLTSGGLTPRWGTNQITEVVPDIFSPVGSLLAATFDALPGTDEAFLSGGDSGGGLFIKEGGIWKLAGVNYAIEGNFDTNNITGDGTEFAAALFDKGGLWLGSDANGWTYQNDVPINQPSSLFASRISDSATAINAITSISPVPEPGSMLLLVGSSLVLLTRRRGR